jgi:hypothetical protein
MFENVNDIMVNARKAFEPVGKLGDLGSSLFEKTVDINVQIATDMLNYTTNQLEAISAFESPAQYFEAQRKLAGEYTERAQGYAQAYLETLQEAGKAFTGWTEEATAAATEAVAPPKPKARTGARKKAS